MDVFVPQNQEPEWFSSDFFRSLGKKERDEIFAAASQFCKDNVKEISANLAKSRLEEAYTTLPAKEGSLREGGATEREIQRILDRQKKELAKRFSVRATADRLLSMSDENTLPRAMEVNHKNLSVEKMMEWNNIVGQIHGKYQNIEKTLDEKLNKVLDKIKERSAKDSPDFAMQDLRDIKKVLEEYKEQELPLKDIEITLSNGEKVSFFAENEDLVVAIKDKKGNDIIEDSIDSPKVAAVVSELGGFTKEKNESIKGKSSLITEIREDISKINDKPRQRITDKIEEMRSRMKENLKASEREGVKIDSYNIPSVTLETERGHKVSFIPQEKGEISIEVSGPRGEWVRKCGVDERVEDALQGTDINAYGCIQFADLKEIDKQADTLLNSIKTSLENEPEKDYHVISVARGSDESELTPFTYLVSPSKEDPTKLEIKDATDTINPEIGIQNIGLLDKNNLCNTANKEAITRVVANTVQIMHQAFSKQTLRERFDQFVNEEFGDGKPGSTTVMIPDSTGKKSPVVVSRDTEGHITAVTETGRKPISTLGLYVRFAASPIISVKSKTRNEVNRICKNWIANDKEQSWGNFLRNAADKARENGEYQVSIHGIPKSQTMNLKYDAERNVYSVEMMTEFGIKGKEPEISKVVMTRDELLKNANKDIKWQIKKDLIASMARTVFSSKSYMPEFKHETAIEKMARKGAKVSEINTSLLDKNNGVR